MRSIFLGYLTVAFRMPDISFKRKSAALKMPTGAPFTLIALSAHKTEKGPSCEGPEQD
jgi:hypothetical protein